MTHDLKALRYDSCATRGSHSFTCHPPTHKPYLPLLPSCKALLSWCQLVLLGEQRHIGVRKLPRVSTPRARPRLKPTTS